MNTSSFAAISWSTATFEDAADSLPMEFSALGEHKDLCQGLRGRLFALRCGAEAMHGVVAARFVTTLALAALLIGVVSLVT